MEDDIRNLAEKFLRGECSPDEIEQALVWFNTPEGHNYLKNRLDRDLSQVAEAPDPETYKRVPTSRIKSRLDRARRQQTERTGGANRPGKQRRYSSVFATAASLLLLVAASLLLYHYSSPAGNEGQTEQKEIVYRAGSGEHKDLLLSDGSSVRLNSNSELIMSKGVYTQDKREVTLKGEAFFEIRPNPEKPFIVNTDHAVIRVLGTSFNVKTSTKVQNIQVAVREGKVSFQGKKTSGKQEVVLAENQLGYLDEEQNEIKVEQVAVDNYLSWMTRRLVFDSTPFRRVCTQLERIYDIDCSICDEQLNQIRFTANFERESLEKTLEIISGSLEISYQMEGNSVTWMKRRQSDKE